MTSLTEILLGIPSSVPSHLLTLDFVCTFDQVSKTDFVERSKKEHHFHSPL